MTDLPPAEERPRLELKPLEIGAGAGAAVITAFASSALGVAGTIGGAAVASVLTTVSSSVLRHSAHRTTQTLRRRVTMPIGTPAGGRPLDAPVGGRLRSPLGPVGGPMGGPTGYADRATGTGPGATDRPGQAYLPGGVGWPDEPGPGEPELAGPAGAEWGEVSQHKPAGKGGRWPRWVVMAGAAAAAFVLAMAGISAVEAAIGRPLSGLFGHGGDGRSSVQQVFGGHSDATPTRAPTGSTSSGNTSTGGQNTGGSTAPAQPSASNQPPATSPAPPPPADTGGAGDTGGGAAGAGATP